MSFYSSIASNYKHIFPLNPSQVNFVLRHAPVESHPNLLEIGSAIGSLSNALKEAGYKASGLELDENMVEIAQELYPSTSFSAENMLNITKVAAPNTMDTLICFGNTLVHLTGDNELNNFLDSAYSTLRPGGVLLVQFINYDRIIDQHVNSLPTIDNEHITFERKYELINETSIHFNTTLLTKSNNEKLNNTQTLYPLRNQAFQDMAQKAGFSVCEFGNFANAPWDKQTLQSIFVCTKA